MSKFVPTGPTVEEVLTKLQNVDQKLITTHEKYALMHQIVYAGQDATEDIALFLKNIQGINNDNLYKILVYLEKYDELALALTTSTKLVSIFELITPYPTPNDKVKGVLLEMFLKATEPNTVSRISNENILTIFKLTCGAILNNDLEIANVAGKLVERLLDMNPTELIPIVQTFCNLSSSSTIQLRFVAVLSRQAMKSNELFQLCNEVGIVQVVINLCKESDILTQVNALEYLPPLASTLAGLDCLCSSGIMTWLVNVACEQQVEVDGKVITPDPVLSTETLRVLGTIFHKAASLAFDLTLKLRSGVFKFFLKSILNYFEEGDETHKIAGIGILCEFISISHNTLKMVMEDERLMREWIGVVNSSKPELVAAVLHSIAKVLHQEDSLYVGSGVVSVALQSSDVMMADTQQSAESLKHNVIATKKRILTMVTETKRMHYTAYLLKLATLPVASVRYAAVDLMTAIVAQPSGWGLVDFAQGSVQSNVTFAEYIVNRETEYCKEGKDWKFSLIKAVSMNPARQMMSEAFNKNIDLLIAQGPYFMPPRVAVETL